MPPRFDLNVLHPVNKEDHQSRVRKFRRTVLAVHEIVSKKLYRHKTSNLEAYFRDAWRISRAQQLDGFSELPCRERLCRSLKRLAKSRSEMRLLWERVLQRVRDEQASLTSTIIESIWKELLRDNLVSGLADPNDPIIDELPPDEDAVAAEPIAEPVSAAGFAEPDVDDAGEPDDAEGNETIEPDVSLDEAHDEDAAAAARAVMALHDHEYLQKPRLPSDFHRSSMTPSTHYRQLQSSPLASAAAHILIAGSSQSSGSALRQDPSSTASSPILRGQADCQRSTGAISAASSGVHQASHGLESMSGGGFGNQAPFAPPMLPSASNEQEEPHWIWTSPRAKLLFASMCPSIQLGMLSATCSILQAINKRGFALRSIDNDHGVPVDWELVPLDPAQSAIPLTTEGIQSQPHMLEHLQPQLQQMQYLQNRQKHHPRWRAPVRSQAHTPLALQRLSSYVPIQPRLQCHPADAVAASESISNFQAAQSMPGQINNADLQLRPILSALAARNESENTTRTNGAAVDDPPRSQPDNAPPSSSTTTVHEQQLHPSQPLLEGGAVTPARHSSPQPQHMPSDPRLALSPPPHDLNHTAEQEHMAPIADDSQPVKNGLALPHLAPATNGLAHEQPADADSAASHSEKRTADAVPTDETPAPEDAAEAMRGKRPRSPDLPDSPSSSIAREDLLARRTRQRRQAPSVAASATTAAEASQDGPSSQPDASPGGSRPASPEMEEGMRKTNAANQLSIISLTADMECLRTATLCSSSMPLSAPPAAT
ncbi:hypothetical protein HK105_200502 [Polyrhizophydium stewartii]|uniref:Uncharacterized protein n=1 Tax=Polyrhizophydium stewartii TaxID=2732419 RepID=A0ABR4NJE5_9FUNG